MTSQTERFRLMVSDTFTITSRGTVIAGFVQSGTVHTGDVIDLVHGGSTVRLRCLAVELLRPLEPADGPPPVGLLVRGVRPFSVLPGDLVLGGPSPHSLPPVPGST